MRGNVDVNKICAYLKKRKPTIFDSGIGARLPTEYRKFYDEWRNTPPKPIHMKPLYEGITWVRDEQTGEVKRVEDIPLKGKVPKELNDVFTGGEVMIHGFMKKSTFSSRIPRFWTPTAFRSVIYSEILDKYMSTMMTKRVVELIHEHRGLDSYLLQTKACDLVTLVAIGLKRKLLLALRDRELPYDESKNQEIYEKYRPYLLPPEEVEWYGLSFTEACRKLKEIEEREKQAQIVPLKNVYREMFIKHLKENPPEDSNIAKSGWLTKIPGIGNFAKHSDTA